MSWVCFWRKKASCLGGDCSRCGGWSVRKCESHGFCGSSVGIWACVCLTNKSGRNLWLRGNTRKHFYILFIEKLGASGVAVGEMCSFDGVMLPFPDRTRRPPVYVFFFFFFLPSTSLWGFYSETLIHCYSISLAHAFTRLCMIFVPHMYILHYNYYNYNNY